MCYCFTVLKAATEGNTTFSGTVLKLYCSFGSMNYCTNLLLSNSRSKKKNKQQQKKNEKAKKKKPKSS